MDPRKPSRDDKSSDRQDRVVVSVSEEHEVAGRVPAVKNQATLMQEACEREEERYETFRLRMMDTQRRKK
jgi:hypothetical protein